MFFLSQSDFCADPVCVKPRGEVVADILAAIKERRA
jgi:hypothetical protein